MANQVEVVQTSSEEVEVYSPALLAMCQQQDPQEVLKRFARRFDQAGTLDELFDVLQGTNSQMLIGRALEVRHVEWAPYQAERGTIPLAIVQAADIDGGELIEFATTGAMMCLFLYKWQLLKLKPFQARIVGKKTNSGQTALNFERL
jgi:hypothetical protein